MNQNSVDPSFGVEAYNVVEQRRWCSILRQLNQAPIDRGLFRHSCFGTDIRPACRMVAHDHDVQAGLTAGNLRKPLGAKSHSAPQSFCVALAVNQQGHRVSFSEPNNAVPHGSLIRTAAVAPKSDSARSDGA